MELQFHPDSDWKRMYSRNLLMLGREDVRNTWSFMTEYIWIISAYFWLFNKKYNNIELFYSHCWERNERCLLARRSMWI